MHTWSDFPAPVQTFFAAVALAAAVYCLGHGMFEFVMWRISA